MSKYFSLKYFLVYLLSFISTTSFVYADAIAPTVCYNNTDSGNKHTIKGVTHYKETQILNGKPASINIIIIDPKVAKVKIRPTYGEYMLNSVKKVSDFAEPEKAIAAINASFFKPDIGSPLGVSIIDGQLLTGPIYERVVFGATDDNEFIMDKVQIKGKVFIGEDLKLKLHNYNQPLFSKEAYTVFTDRWSEKTPSTPLDYCQIVVENNKIQYVKQSSVPIPKGGFVIVGPRKYLRGKINRLDSVNYEMEIKPKAWREAKYAIGGGPYLVKKGKIFVDRQKFTDKFLWKKEPRTAIGYTLDGELILVTIDGRKKGVSEGATMPELAHVMWDLGAYNAMNLDGGSSTQMVYMGQIVNMPTVKGGGKVTNALLVIPDNN